MPVFYQHRVNTLAAVRALTPGLGLEFDVRDTAGRLVVTHDPFTEGPPLDEFLALASGRPLIVNVKSDGIDGAVLTALEAAGARDFFLLDCAAPTLVRLVVRGEHRVAVRWSEWEPAAALEPFRGRAGWLWVDCFTTYPGDAATWRDLAAGFRICLVSPELQGHGLDAIPRFRDALADRPFHAVCTKAPAAWGFATGAAP